MQPLEDYNGTREDFFRYAEVLMAGVPVAKKDEVWETVQTVGAEETWESTRGLSLDKLFLQWLQSDGALYDYPGPDAAKPDRIKASADESSTRIARAISALRHGEDKGTAAAFVASKEEWRAAKTQYENPPQYVSKATGEEWWKD